MKLQHPIQYQGSKRNLAATILEYFPANVQTEKANLITQLEKLSKAQTVIKNDIYAVKTAV